MSKGAMVNQTCIHTWNLYDIDKIGQMLDIYLALYIFVPVILSAWHIKLTKRDWFLLKLKN